MDLYAKAYSCLTIRELQMMVPYLKALGVRAVERLEAVTYLLADPENRLVYPRARRTRRKKKQPRWAPVIAK